MGNDQFGTSISVDDGYLLVGAPFDDGYGSNGSNGTDTGAVYIFKRFDTTWSLEQELSDKSTGFTALLGNDQFGSGCRSG